MEKTFSGQIFVFQRLRRQHPFLQKTIRSHTKGRDTEPHFCNPPPSFGGGPCHPPPPQSNFQVALEGQMGPEPRVQCGMRTRCGPWSRSPVPSVGSGAAMPALRRRALRSPGANRGLRGGWLANGSL